MGTLARLLGDLTYVVRELRLHGREFKLLVEDGDDVLLVLEGAPQLLVDPVLAVAVVQQPVQRVGRQDENEVLRRLNVLEQMGVELSRVQLVHVNEHLCEVS